MSIKLGTTNIAGGIPDISVINGAVISILNSLYPIGALYITSNSATTCPMQTLGVGSWELVAQDRVLQGAGTRGTVGSTLPESLPNITGSIGQDAGRPFINPTGALQSGGGTGSNTAVGGNTAIQDISFSFNASGSSSIYQDNAHVQPSAYLVNIWKRTA